MSAHSYWTPNWVLIVIFFVESVSRLSLFLGNGAVQQRTSCLQPLVKSTICLTICFDVFQRELFFGMSGFWRNFKNFQFSVANIFKSFSGESFCCFCLQLVVVLSKKNVCFVKLKDNFFSISAVLSYLCLDAISNLVSHCCS